MCPGNLTLIPDPFLPELKNIENQAATSICDTVLIAKEPALAGPGAGLSSDLASQRWDHYWPSHPEL